jgi:threonine/homoserine/homoserine lactone efflux protein
MMDWLPPWPLLSAFLAASLLLAVTPGPGVLYILSRSLAHGRHHALASVAGVAAGNLAGAIAASVGLAALLAVSSTAFLALKYAGALYLIYLGLRALRRVPTDIAPAVGPCARLGRTFRDGFVVAFLNPKTTLFFGAFLPQFVGPTPEPMIRSVALDAVFVAVAVAAVTDTAYALTASAAAPVLAGSARARALRRHLHAGTLIGLGLFATLTNTHRTN